MKAFLQFPGFEFRWSAEQLSSALALWTFLPGETGFRDVFQLPPASYLVCRPGALVVEPYSRLELAPPTFTGPLDEAADITRQKLSDSVRLRLRSDVPVGAYLSGGLDSAIVTLLATRHAAASVSTFSIGFADCEFDESPAQREVSDWLGTRHSHLRVTAKDIAEHFFEAIWF
jgi:asparagine synthase (glutamine-hydrolysing)